MQDLPSGYNSGEQYDTLSTGYMSGEAYELPETRPEPMEPTLASIDEVSAKSNEDLFTIGQPSIYQEGNILVQMEQLASSSSSASIPSPAEVTGALETIGIMKNKRAKKQVSYHISVPMDKSPLGTEGYKEIPSDTDTTSCFDSDGTYMRSEGQSSDSGAALLSHGGSRGRRGRERRGQGAGGGGRGGGRAGLGKKMKKARQVIRSHEDFFTIHDNKYWMVARQACFWSSIASILVCIVTASVMIGLMPRSCDPETEWWQGTVILDVSPSWTSGLARLNLSDLISNVEKYKELGIQAIKLSSLYRAAPANSSEAWEAAGWVSCTNISLVKTRLDLALVPVLAESLHAQEMQLMVDLPALEPLREDGRMSLALRQSVTVAIKTWAEMGVDGISLTGLQIFARDSYMAINAQNWKVDFIKYGISPYRKILSASYLLPENIQENFLASSGGEGGGPGTASREEKLHPLTGFEGIGSFDMLEANIKISQSAGESDLESVIQSVAQWDQAPSQPWINWNYQLSLQVNQAEFAFHLLLPGTISIQLGEQNLNVEDERLLLSRLIELRKSSVPIFMNGNFKACHAHCDGPAEKVDNYKVHLMRNNSLVLLERTFNRRNRYMVIANIASTNSSLESVASLYSSGEVILDTTDLDAQPRPIKFKDADLPGWEALVIKFPK